MDDVHNIFRVIVFQKLKNFKFHTSLVVILFFVLYYFHRNFFACFVVNAFEGGSEGAFA